jgi:hypothetical protein
LVAPLQLRDYITEGDKVGGSRSPEKGHVSQTKNRYVLKSSLIKFSFKSSFIGLEVSLKW